MADSTLYDSDEAKSLVEQWLSGKTGAAVEEEHDENELQAEKSSMLMGLNTSKRSIQQLKALTGETSDDYKQQLLERKKEFAKKQKDYDNENVDSRSSRLGKKAEKKSKFQEILEKKNAKSASKPTTTATVAEGAANADALGSTADGAKPESETQESAQQAIVNEAQEQQKPAAQRQRINPLRWLVETIPILLKETGAEAVPLTLLGKKFRETFSRHFPGVAKAPMRKFLENARNFKANKPYFCVTEPEGDPQREVYVRMWKEGDSEKAAPAPTPVGEQKRRKTKTRSKQKNRKKDHRPDSLKPAASQPTQNQHSGKVMEGSKALQSTSAKQQQTEESKQDTKSFDVNWDEYHNTKEKTEQADVKTILNEYTKKSATLHPVSHALFVDDSKKSKANNKRARDNQMKGKGMERNKKQKLD